MTAKNTAATAATVAGVGCGGTALLVGCGVLALVGLAVAVVVLTVLAGSAAAP